MTDTSVVAGAVRQFLATAGDARRAHVEMLRLAWHVGDRREIVAQVARIAGAAVVTWAWVPDGNTGRSSMSAFASEPVPDDLASLRRRSVAGAEE